MLIKHFPWQEPVWEGLLARRRTLPHALLFRGKQGTGKAGFARALAQALLCEAARGGAACGACSSCGWFSQGTHPDFRSVEPEAIAGEKAEAEEGSERKPGERRARQQITVDQVRELADFVNLSSHRQGFKVVLIHPAESLNIHAANALLKTLEEPPPGTLFLLVSHRPRRVLPTILSRCEQVPMPVPALELAERWLREQGVAEPAVPLAEAGFAPVAALGVAEPARQALRAGFLESLAAPAALDAISVAERLQAAEPAVVVGWLQRWCYDLLRLRSGAAPRFNPDFGAALKKLAPAADERGLLACLRLLSEAQRIAHHPLNPRLFLESLLLYYSRSIMPATDSQRG